MQEVRHRVHAFFSREPARRRQRPLGEHAPVARVVLDPQLLERAVPGTWPRRTLVMDKGTLLPNAALVRRASSSAVPEGASFFAAWCVSVMCASNSAPGNWATRRAAYSATCQKTFTPNEKLGAQNMAPPAVRTSASTAARSPYHPVVPTTTGHPAATQARTFVGAAAGVVNSTATSAPPNVSRVIASPRSISATTGTPPSSASWRTARPIFPMPMSASRGAVTPAPRRGRPTGRTPRAARTSPRAAGRRRRSARG